MSCDDFLRAFNTRDVAEFMRLLFPPAWAGVAARVLESGVEFDTGLCDWAPRWSRIPLTVRFGKSDLETAVKSCFFRAHDCLHQLWGLPLPSSRMDEDDFFVYKRAQMCGEIAVLTLVEFGLSQYWYQKYSELQPLINSRNAVPMLIGPLQGKSLLQVAQRLDELLHKKIRPRWVREHAQSLAFVEDYVPMIEADRTNIDHNWELMKSSNWRPATAPNSRYSPLLDGLELTQWMINDFHHLLDTDPEVDEALRRFNCERRSQIVLPSGWNSAA
jgi:hypothetical protein